MTEHEALMENYEDALLRLLMENAARAEGERLIAQLGPAPRLPEADAFSRSLRRHYRRERRRRRSGVVLGYLRQTAVFAALAALIFTSAMAASEAVRTVAWIGSGTKSYPSFVPTGDSPRFEAAWLPWGFELKFSDDTPSQYRRYYADLSGSFIDAACLYLDGVRLDPGPDALAVAVKGRTGFLLDSDGELQFILPVEDQGCLLLLLSSGVSQEDLLRTVERLTCPWE